MENLMEKKKSWTRWIFPAVITLLIVGFIIVVLLSNTEPAPEEEFEAFGYVEGEKTYTLENDDLLFVMDAETTHFTLTQKSNGHVWYSNPVDAKNDPIALGPEKQNLQSTLNIEYTTKNGVVTPYNNYEYSITRFLYEIVPGTDSIRINYTIGDLQREYILPPIAPVDRFEELLSTMEKKAANSVKNAYRKLDINKLSAKDKANKDELVKLYPLMEETPVYVVREGTAEYKLAEIEELFAAAGYTYEDYEADLANFTSTLTKVKPSFNVSMIYRLEGNDLVVDVPLEDIAYRNEYKLTSLTILPFYGAASATDNGYALLPEGGGSIMNFNNGKIAQNNYYSNLYGWNYGQSRDYVVHETHAAYNMYGLCYPESSSSLLCIVDEGESLASIKADIAGRSNNYNYANCIFNVLHSEDFAVNSQQNQPIYVFEDQRKEGKVAMRYRHIDTCDISEMAKTYRSYLINKGAELQMNTADAAPVVFEVIGAIDKTQQVFGVPQSVPLALTTYEEMEEMFQDINQSGYQNVSIQLSGWVNGGIRQQLLNKVKPVRKLGSKKALSSMIETAKSLGMKFYLDGVIDFAYNNTLFDGFSPFSDTAKYTTDERVLLRSYSILYYGPETFKDPYYLVNFENRENNLNNLISAVEKYGASGISFRDEGNILSSDYNRDEVVSREEAVQFISDRMKQIKSEGKSIMIPTGNDYAAVYADMIVDMSLIGNEYTILDSTVPFYEMVLHGFVDYTGTSINLDKDYKEAVLDAAKTGAGLKFTFMKEPVSSVQDTNYYRYYGADYDEWKDIAKDIYERYNRELGNTFACEMTGYRNITPLLSETVYSDGTIVYVNYGTEDYDDGTLSVPAKDYFVKKGADAK